MQFGLGNFYIGSVYDYEAHDGAYANSAKGSNRRVRLPAIVCTYVNIKKRDFYCKYVDRWRGSDVWKVV